jgi:ribonuclease HIII
MDDHNILISLGEPDVKKIRRSLKRRRFELTEREYAHFTAKKGRLHVTVYEKGPKALVQGNEARDFAREVLEPLVMGGVSA